MKELIIHVVKQLVDNPEKVKVKEVKEEQNIILELSIAKEDIGRVIGKQGRTIKALRTLLNAASVKTGHQVTIEVIK